MVGQGVVRRTAVAAALVAAVVVAGGCSSPLWHAGNPAEFAWCYARDRYVDACQMIDGGISITTKPCFALYGHFASLTPIGAGYIDGYFLGLGGGQIGLTRMYLSGYGALIWGYEELGWRHFDPDDMGTLWCQDVGAPGLLLPPYGRPGQVPS